MFYSIDYIDFKNRNAFKVELLTFVMETLKYCIINLVRCKKTLKRNSDIIHKKKSIIFRNIKRKLNSI